MSLSAGELHEVLLRAAASVREELFASEHSEAMQTPIDQTFKMHDDRYYQVVIMEADEDIFKRKHT